jgi:hypothetical protein
MHASTATEVSGVAGDSQLDSRAAARLAEIALGYWLPRCLHIVAELGVADHIASAPVSAALLAQSCEANEDALYRVMRALSSQNIFEQTEDGFAHTALSLPLRSDHPQSVRAFACMIGLPFGWNSFLHLEHVIRTGEIGALKVDPKGLWHYYQQNPNEWALFNDAMESKSHAQIPAILETYDFSRFDSVADVGGGKGHLLRAILESAPNVKGILFDQPHVVASAPASDRVQIVGGDFFAGGIPRSNAYILMQVIHDWNDEQARQILQSVQRSAEPGARLLLIETVMPETSQEHRAYGLDILMLVFVGGKERTREEYAALLESAGFELSNVVPTESGLSIVEAIAV